MSTSQVKKIGLATATIVGMNAMIGAGIFSVPAALALNVGPAGILTYAFVIIAVWCMGTSIARLAQIFPQEGSFYNYAKQWGGHTVGLIAAGSYLIGLIIAMGLLAQVAGTYLHEYFPIVSAYIWGIIVLAALTLLNSVGVVMSELGQMILICTTVFPLIATTILCFTNAQIHHLFPFMPFGLNNVLAATKAVIFGFFGFECAASLFPIVEQPEKNVSRALTLAISLVSIIYLAFVISLILAIPMHNFSIDVPLSTTLARVFPHHTWLIISIHLSILSAILGTIHSMIWSASALLISYVQQFKSPVLARYAAGLTQVKAVCFIGAAIFISFISLKNIDLFFSFTACFLIFAFVLSMMSLFTVPYEWKSGRIVRACVGLITALIIFYFAAEGIILTLRG